MNLAQLFAAHRLSLRGVIHVGAGDGRQVPTYRRLGAREIVLFEAAEAHISTLARHVEAWQREDPSVRIDFFKLAWPSLNGQSNRITTSAQDLSDAAPQQRSTADRGGQAPKETAGACRLDAIITQPSRYNLLWIEPDADELEVLQGAGEPLLRGLDAIHCQRNRSAGEGADMPGSAVDRYLERFGFQRLTTSEAGGPGGTAFYLNQRRAGQPDVPAKTPNDTRPSPENLFLQHGIDIDLASGRKLIAIVNMHDRCSLVQRPSTTTAVGDSQLEALRLVRMGRYSNNIIQLLHGTLIAQQMGIRKLVLPADFADLHGVDLKVESLHIIQQGRPDADTGSQLASYCWFPSGSLRNQFTAISSRRAREAANRIIKPLFFQFFPCLSAAPTGLHPQPKTLVAHLRSGVLFRKPGARSDSAVPHPIYVQPPLSFYQRAIEHALTSDNAPSTIQLVMEDDNNPVGPALSDWLQGMSLDATLVRGDFQQAIETMLNATVIVSAYGSVIEMIGMLSDRLEEAYVFQGYGRWAERSFGGHGRYELLGNLNTIHSLQLEGQYIEAGHWRDTPEQRQQMLSYRASPAAFQHVPVDPHAEGSTPFFLID